MIRLLLLLAAAVVLGRVGVAGEADQVDYLADVKPILASHCFACHGPVEAESGLRLDSGAAILEGGYGGPAVVPGNSGESPLIERLVTTDADLRMPQGRAPLGDEQIAVLRAWIDAGAAVPAEEPTADPKQHWAFLPPQRPEVPALKSDWIRNPIDAFVAARHIEHGLSPRPEADRATLLRRVYLDLIGLPPTADELRDFLTDDSPEAYERVVDRLLASPQHGERWARHWMDVWRYSDWTGYRQELRESQRHMWRWRDWIIESLNADRGYDQMVLAMLAADELHPTDDEALRATGYLARSYYKFNRNVWLENTVEHLGKSLLGLTFNCAKCHDHMYDPISQADFYRLRAFFEPYQVRTDRLPGEPDVVKDGLSRVYDDGANTPTYLFIRGNEATPDESHAYEPGLPEFFCPQPLDIQAVELPAESWLPGVKPYIQQETLAAAHAKVTEAQGAFAAAQQTVEQLAARREAIARQEPAAEGEEENASADTREELAQVTRDLESAREALALAEKRWIAAQAASIAVVARIAADNARAGANDSGDAEALATTAGHAEQQAALRAAEADFLAAEQQLTAAQRALDEADDKTKQEVAAAEKKLNEARERLEAARQAALKPNPSYTSLSEVYPPTSTGRRTALARWIVGRDNPLAARVAINHIWLRHFGTPLVESVFDFGLHGSAPTHPQLFDWLAVEFMENGWSMKTIHRLIVTSSTYRMQSTPDESNLASDPDNRYLWRMPTRRMEAEVVRDSLLHVAGALDLTMGGPELDESEGLTSRRRSIYFRHANEKQVLFLQVFDAASPNECYRRDESVVPQQGLALANSSLTLAQARRLARQLTDDDPAGVEGNAADFVVRAFRRVLSRDPSFEERSACEAFLSRQSARLADADALTPFDAAPQCEVPPAEDPLLRARENLVHVLMNHNDFVTIR